MSPIIQLISLLLVVIVLGVIGYAVYGIIQSIISSGHTRLNERNVTLSSSGATIGVKKRDREDYVDASQKVLVDAWNKSRTEGYKSWLWGKKD